MIESAYHRNAAKIWAQEGPIRGQLFAGGDVARKRDLSVIWLNEHLGDTVWTRAVTVLEKSPFSAQRKAYDDTIALGVRRLCIDANGIGAQISEELLTHYGESRIEPVMMSGQVPAIVAGKVKKAFEDKRIRIPDDVDIRRDLHQVRRVYTDAGNVRFEAPRTRDGHADRFWALGLALQAADGAVPKFEINNGKNEKQNRRDRDDDIGGQDWGYF
jgi:phage FluMu gp28-like protein